MSENIISDPNVQVAYIVTEHGSNTESSTKYQAIAMNTLQIPNENKAVQDLGLPKATDEFSLANLKNNVVYRILRPEDLDLKAPTPENVQKPLKRCKQKKLLANSKQNDQEMNELPKKIFRTRSGRMSKPPKHIQLANISQTIINNVAIDDTSKFTIVAKKTAESVEKIPKLIENKRIISSQYRCATCKKAYLGQNKMLKHLQLNPGHVAPEFNKKSADLFTQFVRKIKTEPKNQQSQLFCQEIINLLYKARSIIPKLLKHTTKDDETNFTVDNIVSNALGIPEGQYTFDDSVSITETLNHVDSNITDTEVNSDIPEAENCHNNDQNSLLNLLDTGQVTFDSSTTTEEVMNVDQLVNERLKTLTGGEMESTNNTVQNLNLDLSLDMFSYNE